MLPDYPEQLLTLALQRGAIQSWRRQDGLLLVATALGGVEIPEIAWRSHAFMWGLWLGLTAFDAPVLGPDEQDYRVPLKVHREVRVPPAERTTATERSLLMSAFLVDPEAHLVIHEHETGEIHAELT